MSSQRLGAALTPGFESSVPELVSKVELSAPRAWQAQEHGQSPRGGWQGKDFSLYRVAVNWGNAKDAAPTPLQWGWGVGNGQWGCLIIEGLPWGASDIGNPHD